jgi:hypothetical protein
VGYIRHIMTSGNVHLFTMLVCVCQIATLGCVHHIATMRSVRHVATFGNVCHNATMDMCATLQHEDMFIKL